MNEQTKPIKLSKRQKQLLAMLEKGMPNKAIAEQMEISEHTVKVHFWRLFKRLGVNSRTQALKWWHDNQPTGMNHAIRAAYDAACRMADRLKSLGYNAGLEEFEHHRTAVAKMEGSTT